jgi:hypothetical protein
LRGVGSAIRVNSTDSSKNQFGTARAWIFRFLCRFVVGRTIAFIRTPSTVFMARKTIRTATFDDDLEYLSEILADRSAIPALRGIKARAHRPLVTFHRQFELEFAGARPE